MSFMCEMICSSQVQLLNDKELLDHLRSKFSLQINNINNPETDYMETPSLQVPISLISVSEIDQ